MKLSFGTLGVALAFAVALPALTLAAWQGAASQRAANGQPTTKMTEKGLYRTKNAMHPGAKTELASFAAGCFWGVEQAFRELPGVVGTAVGYTGGHVQNPTYKQVCSDTTGHAEAVLVEYDPNVISYGKLLQEFWDLHDPTELNRQGPDVGEQYRSAIFTFNDAQKKLAMETRDRLQASGELGKKKIVTEIVPATKFYFAEEYHQQWVEKGNPAYCHRRKPKVGG